MQRPYPVTFTVDYPERKLSRLTTALRLIWVIPIAFVVAMVSGGSWQYSSVSETENVSMLFIGSGGILLVPVVLMLLVKQKYPRWWFDWNLELNRFTNRVTTYLALMNDEYPSTDEHQSVHLNYLYPEPGQLSRWKPLVKWLLAVPHWIALFFLNIAAFFVVVIAWFAILITGRYPRGLFDFVEGVLRWDNRVAGYAITLVTDEYPPFSLD